MIKPPNFSKNLQSKPKASCPLCHGKGFLRIEKDGYPFVKRCNCQREQVFHHILLKSGLPEKFWNTTLASKSVDGREPFIPFGGSGKIAAANKQIAKKSQSEALKVCRNLKTLYINYFLEGKRDEDVYGLLLHGKPGRGKTRLICSLLRDLIESGLHDVRFVEYNHLFKQIRQSFSGNGPSYQEIFKPLLNASVLAIDDLGTEITGSTVFLLDQMGYIINERYNKNLPTLFTCNNWLSIKEHDLPLEKQDDLQPDQDFGNVASHQFGKFFAESDRLRKARDERDQQMLALQQKVSSRLRSRICEMCLEMSVEGFDYRAKIGRNRALKMKMKLHKPTE